MVEHLTFLHCDHVPRCVGAVDKVFEGYSSIQFMASGNLHLAYDTQTYDLEGAWAWAAWPGPKTVFHKGYSVAHWDHRYIAFRGERVDQWKEAGLLPDAPLRIDRIGSLAYDLDRIIVHVRASTDADIRIAGYLIEAMLLALKAARYCNEKKADLVSAVEAWLFEHRAGPPDYRLLARDLAMGESTLRRKYREETGGSLHARYLEIRLDAARDLIADQKLPIKEIAHTLGFSDVYHLSKQFKRRFGVPPATFRRSIQSRFANAQSGSGQG